MSLNKTDHKNIFFCHKKFIYFIFFLWQKKEYYWYIFLREIFYKGKNMSNSEVLSALNNLTEDDIDRLRYRLWTRFYERLKRIPIAPNPDDLLYESIDNLLSGNRNCPLSKITLTKCLYNIVYSKVSHIEDKWRRLGVHRSNSEFEVSTDIFGLRISKYDFKINDACVDSITQADEQSRLNKYILSIVEDDELVKRIVKIQIEHLKFSDEPLQPRHLASELNISIQDIYNAIKRLKRKIKKGKRT